MKSVEIRIPSSLKIVFLRSTTHFGLWKLLWLPWLSSLLENFVHVKTPMVLKRFEVGKSQYWRANGTFPPCLGGCAIKNCFGIISGLSIAFNCIEGSFADSKLIWVYNYLYLISGWFFRELAQEAIEIKNCFGTYEWRLTHRLQLCQTDLDGSKTHMDIRRYKVYF